jgi:hypothetical protein
MITAGSEFPSFSAIDAVVTKHFLMLSRYLIIFFLCCRLQVTVSARCSPKRPHHFVCFVGAPTCFVQNPPDFFFFSQRLTHFNKVKIYSTTNYYTLIRSVLPYKNRCRRFESRNHLASCDDGRYGVDNLS